MPTTRCPDRELDFSLAELLEQINTLYEAPPEHSKAPPECITPAQEDDESANAGVEQPNQPTTTVGLDIGDRRITAFVIEPTGDGRLEELSATIAGMTEFFNDLPNASLIAMEATTNSVWIDDLADSLGHLPIVATPARLNDLYPKRNRDDQSDAERLARIAQVDPMILLPVEHRSRQMEQDYTLFQARERLVEHRTALNNFVKNKAKSFGARLPGGRPENLPRVGRDNLPASVLEVVEGTLNEMESLNAEIKRYDKLIKKAAVRYPVVKDLLTSIPGVGTSTALIYVLALQDWRRFPGTREVKSFLGLAPRLKRSEDRKRELGYITSHPIARRYLIQAASYHLWMHKQETDLQKWGRRLADRKGEDGRKIAQFSTAGKIAGLLWRLWKDGMLYMPHSGKEYEVELHN